MLTPKKGILRTRDHLELMIFAYNYYCYINISRLAYWIFDRIRKFFSAYSKFPGYGRPGIKSYIYTCQSIVYGHFPGIESKHDA